MVEKSAAPTTSPSAASTEDGDGECLDERDAPGGHLRSALREMRGTAASSGIKAHPLALAEAGRDLDVLFDAT
jgi:hypothetical protein